MVRLLRGMLLGLLALLVTPALRDDRMGSADEEKDRAPFELVGPVGPSDASFPFSMAFSPDGKWAAFADGHRQYLEIYEVDGWRRAWPNEGPWRDGSTHAICFSPDSKRARRVAGRPADRNPALAPDCVVEVIGRTRRRS